METTKRIEWEWITSTAANWGAAVAALLFGHSFANDQAIVRHLSNVDAVYVGNLNTQVFAGLLVAVFASYLLAGSRQWVGLGSVLAVATLAGTYLWASQVLKISLGPQLIALVIPACCHLLAMKLRAVEVQRSEIEARDVSPTNITQPQPTPSSPEELTTAVA